MAVDCLAGDIRKESDASSLSRWLYLLLMDTPLRRFLSAHKSLYHCELLTEKSKGHNF
jgi:hypothetical protein